MAYSRWSDSVWYIYWVGIHGVDMHRKATQTIKVGFKHDLDKAKEYQYGQLKKMNHATIKFDFDCTEEQAKEAWGYIKTFMKDVEKHEYKY